MLGLKGENWDLAKLFSFKMDKIPKIFGLNLVYIINVCTITIRYVTCVKFEFEIQILLYVIHPNMTVYTLTLHIRFPKNILDKYNIILALFQRLKNGAKIREI